MLVSDLLLTKRRTGHTEYMLRAALRDPKVIIVCANERQCFDLLKRYRKMVAAKSWFVRMWWKYTKRREPVFTSIGIARNHTLGMIEPCMFDNLTLIQDHQR